MTKSIQSRPRDGKTHFFVVTYMQKFKEFSTCFLWFGSPWEMWILKLFRRHQLFEAMLILTVPGLRNIIFEEKDMFGKYFSKIFEENKMDDVLELELWSWVDRHNGVNNIKNQDGDEGKDIALPTCCIIGVAEIPVAEFLGFLDNSRMVKHKNICIYILYYFPSTIKALSNLRLPSWA